MESRPIDIAELAAIEYHGIAGVSRECHEAVLRLLQTGADISHVKILTASNSHCLLLKNSIEDVVAIKSGFSSGYGGTGPSYFSLTLQFLEMHNAEISEYEVDENILERIDRSALTKLDIQKIESLQPFLPTRWRDYIHSDDQERAFNGKLWQRTQPIVPFAIIDNRLANLVISFWSSPDDRLSKGYRRLEDVVRERTGLTDHGTKLFSKAFGGEDPPLHWKNAGDGERAGRINLFTGAYMAYRNPRAHRELDCLPSELLSELLLLNLLFRLESEAQLSHYERDENRPD